MEISYQLTEDDYRQGYKAYPSGPQRERLSATKGLVTLAIVIFRKLVRNLHADGLYCSQLQLIGLSCLTVVISICTQNPAGSFGPGRVNECNQAVDFGFVRFHLPTRNVRNYVGAYSYE